MSVTTAGGLFVFMSHHSFHTSLRVLVADLLEKYESVGAANMELLTNWREVSVIIVSICN